MGLDGFWWFYKLNEDDFARVQLEFNQASIGVKSIPAVPELSSRPQAPFLTQEQAQSILESILIGRDLSWKLFHRPFHNIAYKILTESLPLSIDNYVEGIIQPRVLPPAILLAGIGHQRFSKLPGHFGNMLIHPSDVEETLKLISQILNVDWESYFDMAKIILEYAGFNDCAKKDVENVLQVIPKALEMVKAEEYGLLALTSWGCP